MAAATSGSAKVVRALLDRGADTMNECQVRPRYTAAHEAAKGGHLDVLVVSDKSKIMGIFSSILKHKKIYRFLFDRECIRFLRNGIMFQC